LPGEIIDRPTGRQKSIFHSAIFKVNEVLVTAYCGTARRAARFLTEKSVSCGVVPSPADSPLVAVCAASSGQWHLRDEGGLLRRFI
jgi:hypothetical protein